MTKTLVTLKGGHHDGEMIYVEPTRQLLAETWVTGERTYPTGTWREDEEVVTTLVNFELYRRVDEDTFQAVAA